MTRIVKKSIIIPIVSIFVISVLLEIFVFNSAYFKIGKNDRGLHAVDINRLVLNDLKIENDKIYITGKNPYFKISNDQYVSFVKLDLDRNGKNFNIYTTDEKGNSSKTYDTNSDVKNFLYIKVNNNIKNLKFYISTINNEKYVGLQGATINNKFYFNIIRFLIVLAVLYILFALIIFKSFLTKNIHITFLIICLTLGTLISICVPPFYSYDECAHFIRAYETGSLNFNFSKTKTSNWVSNIDEFFSYNGHNEIYNFYKDRISNAATFLNNDYSNVKHISSPEDTYLFVPYIPAAAGIFIGKIFRLPFILTFYLGRFTSLLAYSFLGALIIKHIKIAKRLIFAILLFPNAVLMAGAYSVDPMAIIFSIASIAAFVNMLCAEENSIGYKKVAILVGCVAITAMCKMPYAPLILLIFAVPAVKFKNYENRNILLIKILSLVPVGLAAGGNLLYGVIKNVSQWPVPGVNAKGQVLFILHHLPTYIYIVYNFTATSILSNIESSISLLAYCGSIDSIWILSVMVTIIIIAFADDESDILKFSIKQKIVILLSAVLSWGLAISALYITFTPVGKQTIDGFQGRYIIPLLLPVLLLMKNDKISNKFKKENLNYFIIFEFVVILIVSIIKIFLEYSK